MPIQRLTRSSARKEASDSTIRPGSVPSVPRQTQPSNNVGNTTQGFTLPSEDGQTESSDTEGREQPLQPGQTCFWCQKAKRKCFLNDCSETPCTKCSDRTRACFFMHPQTYTEGVRPSMKTKGTRFLLMDPQGNQRECSTQPYFYIGDNVTEDSVGSAISQDVTFYPSNGRSEQAEEDEYRAHIEKLFSEDVDFSLKRPPGFSDDAPGSRAEELPDPQGPQHMPDNYGESVFYVPMHQATLDQQPLHPNEPRWPEDDDTQSVYQPSQASPNLNTPSEYIQYACNGELGSADTPFTGISWCESAQQSTHFLDQVEESGLINIYEGYMPILNPQISVGPKIGDQVSSGIGDDLIDPRLRGGSDMSMIQPNPFDPSRDT